MTLHYTVIDLKDVQNLLVQVTRGMISVLYQKGILLGQIAGHTLLIH